MCSKLLGPIAPALSDSSVLHNHGSPTVRATSQRHDTDLTNDTDLTHDDHTITRAHDTRGAPSHRTRVTYLHAHPRDPPTMTHQPTTEPPMHRCIPPPAGGRIHVRILDGRRSPLDHHITQRRYRCVPLHTRHTLIPHATRALHRDANQIRVVRLVCGHVVVMWLWPGRAVDACKTLALLARRTSCLRKVNGSTAVSY